MRCKLPDPVEVIRDGDRYPDRYLDIDHDSYSGSQIEVDGYVTNKAISRPLALWDKTRSF